MASWLAETPPSTPEADVRAVPITHLSCGQGRDPPPTPPHPSGGRPGLASPAALRRVTSAPGQLSRAGLGGMGVGGPALRL